jgi:hypothetical protein
MARRCQIARNGDGIDPRHTPGFPRVAHRVWLGSSRLSGRRCPQARSPRGSGALPLGAAAAGTASDPSHPRSSARPWPSEAPQGSVRGGWGPAGRQAGAAPKRRPRKPQARSDGHPAGADAREALSPGEAPGYTGCVGIRRSPRRRSARTLPSPASLAFPPAGPPASARHDRDPHEDRRVTNPSWSLLSGYKTVHRQPTPRGQ